MEFIKISYKPFSFLEEFIICNMNITYLSYADHNCISRNIVKLAIIELGLRTIKCS